MAIPKATSTLSDLFLPSMGISMIWSLSESKSGSTPLTSFPTINKIGYLTSGNSENTDRDSLVCSSASKWNPSDFSCLAVSMAFLEYVHPTEELAPNAVLLTFGLSGVVVIPHK